MWEVTCEEIYREMYMEEELKKEYAKEEEKNLEYIIVGTINGKESLIKTCFTKDNAEKVLHRMLNNPDKYDKMDLKKGYTNIRIEATEKKNCWWNW